MVNRPRTEYSIRDDCQVCQVEVRVGPVDVPAVAKGENATRLEALPPGAPVVIEGKIVVRKWQVGKQTHTRLVVDVTKVTSETT